MAPRTHQELFNLRHSSLRSAAAECGFGLLKGKWRRLRTATVAKISVMQSMLLAACYLHNYVINSGCIYENMDVMSVRELKSLATELDFHIDWSAPEWQVDLDNNGMPDVEEPQPEHELEFEDKDEDSTYATSSSQLRADVARHGFARYLLWRRRVKGKQLRGTALGAHVAQLAAIHEQSVAITNPPANGGGLS